MAVKIIKAVITSMLVLIWMLAILSLSGCNTERSGHFFPKHATDTIPVAGPTRVSIDLLTDIVKIRNCEYIKSGVHGGYVYVHCADCTNPIHLPSNK